MLSRFLKALMSPIADELEKTEREGFVICITAYELIHGTYRLSDHIHATTAKSWAVVVRLRESRDVYHSQGCRHSTLPYTRAR